jgi:hypothetical protein
LFQIKIKIDVEVKRPSWRWRWRWRWRRGGVLWSLHIPKSFESSTKPKKKKKVIARKCFS